MANRTMQAETSSVRDTRVDVSPLVGTWYGVKLDENHIAKLEIIERDGTLLIHPYGTPDSELPDWGQVEAIPHTASGSTTASGFQAHFRLDAARIDFVAVENQGLILVQGFTSYLDGSGRNEFAKGYFRRVPAELVSTTGISTGTLTGEWVNSNPTPDWVTRFTLTEDDDTRTIRIWGVSDPLDWGEAEITAYQDKYGEANLYAVYDLEPFEAVIGVISVKNVVVLNQFRRYKDSESINTFRREFFFRNR